MQTITTRSALPRDRAQFAARLLGEVTRRPLVIFLALACSVLALLGTHALMRLNVLEAAFARGQEDATMSVSASREAWTEFVRIRLAQGKRAMIADPAQRELADGQIDAMRRSLADRLGLVAGRGRSVRATQTAVQAGEAANAWYDQATKQETGEDWSASLADLDRAAMVADRQFDGLARIVEADAAETRAAFSDMLAQAERYVIAKIVIGILLLGCLAWLIDRYRWRAVKRVADAAESDASGRTEAGALGNLKEAWGFLSDPTEHLLDALRIAVERETALRNDPIYRLADALEAARDGVILFDARGRVVFANAAAAWNSQRHVPATSDPESEVHLPDGRHLRVSRSAITSGGVLAIYGDVSRSAQEREDLAGQNRNLQTALDDMSQGLCVYDAKGRLAVVNRRYSEIYRLPPGAVRIGMMAGEVLEASIAAGNHPGQSLPDLLDNVWRAFAPDDEGAYIQEIDEGRAIQIRGRATADGGFVATYEDVTERWHAASRIAHMARHDTLTGLPNRVLLGERIEGAITQAARDSGFALLCLDLDNFKQVNDTLGHAVGDELLGAVAHRLAGCAREIDTVARLGGDEFAIVQAAAERPVDAAILAARIIEVVSAPYQLADHAVTVGVSIGIALAPRDGMDADRLLKNADVALYRAKGDGRGTFRFFEAAMDARLQARRTLELDLRAAIAAGDFELHYQPIYDLKQNRIGGFEALLRWHHATRGPVSPMDFIPLAEEVGLIVPLGEWVLAKACEEASRWPDELKVAVNVSPAQFQSAQLINVVRENLARSGLAASRLQLEITESVLLVNGNATIAILHALRTIGVGISMDDFGTGYSSLSYLRSFPFDKMKIDKSFIRDLTTENGSGFIVRAVISLGASLGMTMTAEGVETEEQLARLREEGCDEVQGYLFSPPVPSSQLPVLLEKWNGSAAQAA